MNRQRLLLVGAGGHAHACIDVIEAHGQYEIIGLIGMPEELGQRHLGYEVIGTDADLPQLAVSCTHAIVAVGQIQSPVPRIALYRRLKELGFSLPVIAAPSARVSPHAQVGEGTIIMHGATINVGVHIGRNCIINTHALVEHDSEVGDHCHVSTGVILNGNVAVGEGTFIGSGSILKEGIAVGINSLVGMGVTVRHALPDGSRYVGCATT